MKNDPHEWVKGLEVPINWPLQSHHNLLLLLRLFHQITRAMSFSHSFLFCISSSLTLSSAFIAVINPVLYTEITLFISDIYQCRLLPDSPGNCLGKMWTHFLDVFGFFWKNCKTELFWKFLGKIHSFRISNFVIY